MHQQREKLLAELILLVNDWLLRELHKISLFSSEMACEILLHIELTFVQFVFNKSIQNFSARPGAK